MSKNDLYLRFCGQSTEELEKLLADYNDELAKMVCINNLDTIIESKDIIEGILKERANGAE